MEMKEVTQSSGILESCYKIKDEELCTEEIHIKSEVEDIQINANDYGSICTDEHSEYLALDLKKVKTEVTDLSENKLGLDLEAYKDKEPVAYDLNIKDELEDGPIDGNNEVQLTTSKFCKGQDSRFPEVKMEISLEQRTSNGESSNSNSQYFERQSSDTYDDETNNDVELSYTGEKSYACDLCDYKFAIKSNLTVHIMRTHTGEKPYACDKCSYTCVTKSQLIIHIRTHTGEKPYACDILCGYKCSAKANLIRHMRTHTGVKPYSCDICSYKCAEKSKLTKHIRTHTGEKLYACDVCSHKFATKLNLTVHIMRMHTDEKPYACDICSYTCVTKSQLTSHIRTHTGEKPYACDICGYKGVTKSRLISHIRTHTGAKPYGCDICGYKFAYKSYLTVHLRTHTGEKP